MTIFYGATLLALSAFLGLRWIGQVRAKREKAVTLGSRKYRILLLYLREIDRRLRQAGHFSQSAEKLCIRQIGLTTILIFFSFLLFLMGLQKPASLALVSASLPLALPFFILGRQARKRREEIRSALPYFLDLLALALEAGLDLLAAAEEVMGKKRERPLDQEMFLTLNSIRMGYSRAEAFLQLADRTKIETLRILAATVSQSEQVGCSLGSLLRVQAEYLRRQCWHEAEQRAQKAPLKILIPLTGFIFPAVLLILFGPLALHFLSSF